MIVIGSSSFIGKHFLKAFPHAIATHHREGPYIVDLSHPLVEHLPKASYAIVCAGMANPKACEENPQKSYQCNVEGTLTLARALIAKGITPVLFSTDYVFDGSCEKYGETASTTPLNHYGKQKAELENQALKLDCLIIRLSKVYGNEKGDRSLLDEMAGMINQGKEVKAAHDQVFAPIHVNDVVRCTIELLKKGERGLFNLAGERVFPRHEIAMMLGRRMNRAELVKKISLDDLGDAFLRPKKTILDIQKLKNTLGFTLTSLEESIENIARSYGVN